MNDPSPAVRKPPWRSIRFSLAVIALGFLSGCSGRSDDLDLSMYQYRDTKNLVRFVHSAAVRLESDQNAISYFTEHHDEYYSPDHYLYIYDTEGINVFHAGMEYLEGRNLRNEMPYDTLERQKH